MKTELDIKSQLGLIREKLSEAQNAWREYVTTLDNEKEALRKRYPELLEPDTRAIQEQASHALARLQAVEAHHNERAAVCEGIGVERQRFSVEDLLVMAMQQSPIGPTTPMWQLKIAIAHVDEFMRRAEQRLSFQELVMHYRLKALEVRYAHVNTLVNDECWTRRCGLKDASLEWNLFVHTVREMMDDDNEFRRSIEDSACDASRDMYFDGGVHFPLNELALWMSQAGIPLARQTLITEYFKTVT
jgi:hypothetical protein